MAWVSASIPVQAVMRAGRPRVSSASSSATAGRRRLSDSPTFMWSALSVTIATGDTSLPVPAVVGMATTGRVAPGTLFSP